MGKYVSQTVSLNETIIYEAKPHWISCLPRGIISIILILIGLRGGAGGFILSLIIAAAIMAGPYIRLVTTELGITNKRVIGRYGLIKTLSLDAPLNKINNVSVSSGLFGKILGYGNVVITTSSGGYYYKGITNVEQFKISLMNQIDQFDDDRIKYQAKEMANAIKSAT